MAAPDPTREQVKKVLNTLCFAMEDKPVVSSSGPPATSDLKTTADAWGLFEKPTATKEEKLRALHRIVLATRLGAAGTGAVGDTTAAIPTAIAAPVQTAINGLKDATTGIKGVSELASSSSASAKAANIVRLNTLMPSGGSPAKSDAVHTFLSSFADQTAAAAAIGKITEGNYTAGMALAGGGRRRKSRKARKARKARKSRKARSSRKYRRSRRYRRY
jgi:hypothetical protein